MNYSKTIMTLCLLLFPYVFLCAQNHIVSGTVTDKSGALPGVNVLVKGTDQGTVTDHEGHYKITVSNTDALLFSCLGYKDLSVVVGKKSVIDVLIEEDAQLLEELVVVGYGYQKKSDLATSVASINTEDIIAHPASSVAEMLRGRAAGVSVVTTSGRPGSAPSIQIRGTRSISASNAPLYVIDGSPASATEFSTLGADDIESIEILKDAASQAIYGARASDGVILVTTRRGQAGKTEFKYHGYVGVQTLHRNFDFYSAEEYLELRRWAKANSAELDPSEITDELALADDTMYKNWQNGNYTDWEDLMFKNAIYHNHELSFKKGFEKLRFSANLSYYDQDGMLVTSNGYKRLAFRFNADAKLTKWLSFGINSNISGIRRTLEDGTFNQFIIKSPLGSAFDEDGNVTKHVDSEGTYNPLYRQLHSQKTSNTFLNRLNAFIDITPFKGFKYRLNTSFFNNIVEEQSAKDKDYPGGGASASISETRKINWLVENIFTYDVPFNNKNHRLNLTAVQSIDHTLSKGLGYSANNIPVDMGPDFIANGQITNANRQYGENNLVSFMFRGQYSLMDRYMFNLAIRADGSSRFGANNKWGYFPSAAFAWRISQEPWLKNAKCLNNLKLRISYGAVGNQNGIGNYTTLGVVNSREYEFGDDYYMSYVPGAELPNPNLKWEKSTTANIGVDFGLFNNRLNGTVEYYNTNTSDLIVRRSLNSVIGYTSMLDNLGKTKSQGVDLSLSGDVIRTKDWNWNLTTNISWFENKIVRIDDKVDENGNPADQPGNNWFIGHPIDVNYNYKKVGIYQFEDFNITEVDGHKVYQLKPTIDTDGDGIPDAPLRYNGSEQRKPGDVKIFDRDGDGNITPDDRVITNAAPNFTFSLSTSLSWKGIELYADFYGSFGAIRLNKYLYESAQGGSLQGINNGVKVNYWTPENHSNDFPRPMRTSVVSHFSSCAYQDASYVRLRTLQLSYSFPKGLISKAKMSNLKMYVTATNLLTFTKYSSYSPELATGAYPEGKTFVFGLNVQF